MNAPVPASLNDNRKDPQLESLALLQAFARDLVEITDTDELLWAVAEKTISKLGWEDCVIYLLDDQRNVLVQKAAFGPKNIDYKAIFKPIEISMGEGIVGKAAATGKTIKVGDTRKHAEYIEDDQPRLSELAVPIIYGTKVLGVIDSEHTTLGFYGEAEQSILETIASITATKIEKVRSERESAELALFYKRNPNPVLQLDDKGAIRIINSAARMCFNEAFKEGDILGRPGLDKALDEARMQGMTLWTCQLSDEETGKLRTGEFKVVHLPTGGFNLYGNEITHIIDLQRAAEAANEAKSQFLSVMSHEMRTPLNAILGLTDLLIHDNPQREEQLRHLAYMEFSGRHLLSLVNDILDLEKLASGKATSISSTFNLHQLVDSILESFRNRAEKTGLELRCRLSATLPVMVETDIKWVTQILNNLLGNAIKYTERGTVLLHVENLGNHNGKEALRFSITDTGRGIPVDQQERILQPFEQIRHDPNIEGTGLGLAIVNNLVKLLGGQLSIDSAPDEGSTFSFFIPIRNMDGTQGETPGSEPTSHKATALTDGGDNHPGSGGHEETAPSMTDLATTPVLLADDNELNRFVTCKLLERWGYTVIQADNGQEAVDRWKELGTCIILMDVQMPIMDGVEAARTIRRLEEDEPDHVRSPIIALTADAEEKTLLRVLSSGMDDRIIKPFDPPTLKALLEQFAYRMLRLKDTPT